MHAKTGENIANAAAHILSGRTNLVNSFSDANLLVSDSNDSANGLNSKYLDGKWKF